MVDVLFLFRHNLQSSFHLRFRTYYSETMPIINHFKDRGMVMNVDATPEPEKVYSQKID